MNTKLNVRISSKLSTPSDDCIDHGQKGNPDGYGHSHCERLHRKVFRLIHGFTPPVVMHTCDNPRCINPAHLVAGDHNANNKDRAAKRRSAPVRKDLRRLTREDVLEIRRRFDMRGRRDPVNGVWALAKCFGVDANTIYQVGERRTYRDI